MAVEAAHRLRELARPLLAVLALACAPWAAHAQAAPARAVLCGACHGADGNAVLPGVPSLAAQPRVFTENTLVLIREGLRDIPAMKGLLDGVTDAELVELARHYAGLKPASPGPAQDAALAQRGGEISRRTMCGTCHEPDYRGKEQIPRLAGQREDYLLATMRQFRTGVTPGRDSIMSAALNGLSDADLQALAHYFAHVSAAAR